MTVGNSNRPKNCLPRSGQGQKAKRCSRNLEVGRCTCLTGRLGLVRQDGLRIRLHSRVHQENFGEWHSEPDLVTEKLALVRWLDGQD